MNIHELYQQLPPCHPFFDYEYRSMIAERRLEHLIEWQWEEFFKYGHVTASTHVITISFE